MESAGRIRGERALSRGKQARSATRVEENGKDCEAKGRSAQEGKNSSVQTRPLIQNGRAQDNGIQRKLRFVDFDSFYGVNTPFMAHFQLPT